MMKKILMIKEMPWEAIPTPESNFNVLLIPGQRRIPIYWGKSSRGQYLLIVELDGDHTLQFPKDGVSIRGIAVDLRKSERFECQNLVLSLEKLIDQDLFLGLCQTLITNLDPVTDPAIALALSLVHLKRWKAFLLGRNAQLLSPEEIRGLFAELLFLKTLLSEYGETEAVEAWCGADRVQQDFIFRNTAVEIKSLSGKERNAVRISSEDQLESLTEHLFLKVYHLSTISDSLGGTTLNEMVLQIQAILTEASVHDAYEQRLVAYGYVPLSEYDHPRFTVTADRTYQVIEKFPRIVRKLVAVGLTRISYDIELEVIEEFACKPEKIFREE